MRRTSNTPDTKPAPLGALSKFRVLDFSRLAPGPMATMILADFGADVIKIEEPGGGRRAREERASRARSVSAHASDEHRWRALSPLERNKRSIVIDLRQPDGRDVALRLARSADVVLEGFRPGVMRRLGVGYEAMRAINPRIVYCSITGYGQQGARAPRVGHDLTYLAYAGALSLIGTAESPVVPINVIADYAAGSLSAVTGILAALLARETTGLGQFVDVSMADGVLGLLAVEVARLFSSGQVPRSGTTYLTGGVAYYNVYRTADRKAITIACNEPHFFANLCQLLELPDLIDRQFADAAGQRQNYELMRERFSMHDLDYWVDLLSNQDVPFEPVRALDEVVQDSELWERGVLVQIPSNEFGVVRQVAPTPRLSANPGRVRTLAPRPGADASTILRDIGYEVDDIERLRSARIIAE